MLDLLLNGGKFAGEGMYCSDPDEIIGLPVTCSFEVSQHGTAINVQGFYQHHAGAQKYPFAAEIRYSGKAYYVLTVSGTDSNLGELEGFAAISESGWLLNASGDRGRIQVSQHWTELQADYSFRIHGLVVRADADPLKFDVTVGSVDPQQAKSNVVSLGKSGE